MTELTLKSEFNVARFRVGGEAAPIFLPDIGTFFNQDLALAVDLINGVAAAGAKFLKTEILHDARICVDTDLMETTTSPDGHVFQENYKQVIDRKVLPLSDYASLFDHVRKSGMELVVSVYDEVGIDFAVAQGAAMLKIGSSNIVHKPLISAAAKTGLPTIIDTGKSSLGEISRAVCWFLAGNGELLVLEHSPDAPPAPVDQHGLKSMAVMNEAYGCPVGLSDHHRGNEMLFAASALGASVIEKGVCPDGLAVEQDRAHAIPIAGLADAIRGVNDVALACKGAVRDLVPSRLGNPARMGLMAARDLAAGEVLGIKDLYFAFPALGIPVEDFDKAVGKRVSTAVLAEKPITWFDVEE